MAHPFLAKQKQLEEKIPEWVEAAGERIRVDTIEPYTPHKVYAFTLTNPAVPNAEKTAVYFAQPHAHEPGTTAGMVDVIQQLVTGRDLAGEAASFDVEKALDRLILTFNPIGNADGRERAPVVAWDGSQYTNEQFWCWMRGEDPENPGQMWKRVNEWDIREENAPDPIGIVYEQIDAHRFVEPNRSHDSTYFRLFFRMREMFDYKWWLNLHQMEFVNSDRNGVILLPLEEGPPPDISAENRRWADDIHDAWRADGFRPMDEPIVSNPGEPHRTYFRRVFGALHQDMHILTCEVKNNNADFPPDAQLGANVSAIRATIERLLD